MDRNDGFARIYFDRDGISLLPPFRNFNRVPGYRKKGKDPAMIRTINFGFNKAIGLFQHFWTELIIVPWSFVLVMALPKTQFVVI